MAAELEQLRVSLVAELVGREAFEQLKREVNQVKSATQGLDATQTKLKSTMGDAEKQIRQQRQAFSQTGMQINQFAGQVANGTSPMVAFVQQIGDVTYTLGQAGGALGRFGTFLGGPFATGILIAISVFAPLISKLMESKDAAEEAESAFSKYINSLAATSKVADVFTDNAIAIANARGKVAQLTAELTRLNNTPVEFKGEAAYASAKTATDNRIKSIKSELAANKALIDQKQQEIQTTIKLQTLQSQRKQIEDSIATKRTGSAGSGRISSSSRNIKKDMEEMQTISDLMDDIQNGSAIFRREFVKNMDKVGESIENIGMDSLADNIKFSIETASSAVEQIYQPIERIKSMSEAMGQAFSEGIKGMITGAMSFKNVMSNVIDAVINKLFEMFVVKQITGFIEAGIKSIFPGVKAIGGPVQAGKPYVVGERGPEMFVPSRSGSIVPNNKMSNGMTINVDARGASDPAAVRAQVEMGIAQATPYIIAAAQNKTMKAASRTRLPGTIG